jgi:uncharacterized protein YkwD
MAEYKHVGRRRALVVCGFALLVAAVAPGLGRSANGSGTSASAYERSVVAAMNDVRVSHGLRPLKLDASLNAAARQHTFEMLNVGYFEHESANGGAFSTRIARFYKAGAGTWQVGENLLWGTNSVDVARAVQMWMESPGHRRNILSPSWRDVGVSAVNSATSTGEYGGGPVTIITVDFGVR